MYGIVVYIYHIDLSLLVIYMYVFMSVTYVLLLQSLLCLMQTCTAPSDSAVIDVVQATLERVCMLCVYMTACVMLQLHKCVVLDCVAVG